MSDTLRTPHFPALLIPFLIIVLIFVSPSESSADGIHKMVIRADLLKVKSLIETNPGLVNSRDNEGKTPLAVAASRLKQFLPLEMFEIEQRKSIISLLIANGAEISDLTEAIAAGNMEKVSLFIQENAQAESHKDGFQTPLHCAAFWGQKEISRLLISKGADVNARGPEGTPLHLSAMLGYSGVTELLLSQGAHVDDRDDSGQTPLQMAVKMGSIIYYDPRDRSFHTMEPHLPAEKTNEFVEVIRLIVASGADVNRRQQKNGRADLTPLHIASIRGCRRTAELLITAGSKLNLKDDTYGFTPLHCASANGNSEVVKLLISMGADLNLKDRNGTTPLKAAIEKGQKDMADLLRSHGARE